MIEISCEKRAVRLRQTADNKSIVILIITLLHKVAWKDIQNKREN